MLRFFFLSDYFRPALSKVKSALVILIRALKLIFSRRKKIEIVSLVYFDQIIFERSYFFIEYEFKNVLWFTINKKLIGDNRGIIRVNRQSFPAQEVTIRLQGFFASRSIVLSIAPNHKLLADSFRPAIGPFALQLVTQKTPSFQFAIPTLRKQVLVTQKNIKSHFPPFSSTDFLC
jgi:hypothetical protein